MPIHVPDSHGRSGDRIEAIQTGAMAIRFLMHPSIREAGAWLAATETDKETDDGSEH